MEKRKIMLGAIEKYGMAHQRDKCVEEMGELLQEIARLNNFYRNVRRMDCTEAIKKYIEIRQALIGEIADVQIMIEQMALMVGEKNVREAVEYKLDRLKKEHLGG